ncbi:MAG: TonB-dependent receptor [Parvularculaceae bacterium]|nr:TonB-dependent receptor [Parvularculaceae bacterium]
MAVDTELALLRETKVKLALAAGASAFALTAGMAFAQDPAPAEPVEIIEEDEDEADDSDTVTVTGSRIRRSTFTSISPLQQITTEQSLGAGLLDPAAILQESTAAAGQQIDATFNGFVLDNGPGSQTLNLRGLGASRTLVLINGRRMAPAGVEGAPTQPSINLLPGSLIDTYDLLLDGASSIYGSDAVAGVGNAILRQDFEGFEFFASGDYNEFGGGNDYTFSGAWGKNTDRGFIGIGAEYDFVEEVTFGDRPYLSGCVANYEETLDGEIRRIDIATDAINLADSGGLVGAPTDVDCISTGFNQRFFEQTGALTFGSAYYTPGEGNILADYSDTGLFGVPIDRNQDGVADVFFPNFTNTEDLEGSLIREQKKFSIMGYGEYTFEGDMNITPFFEALYVRLESNGDSGAAGLFPDVPGSNPFNPCNPNQPNGVDCGLAEDDLINSDGYRDPFRNYYANPNAGDFRQIGGNANCFGFGPAACTPELFGLFGGPVGPQPVSAGVSVDGDRTISETVLEQARFLAGVRGDLPQLNFGQMSNWNWEASALYTRSKGTSDRPGIRDDRLALSLGWDPTTDLDGDGEIDSDTNDAIGALLELPGGPCDVDGLSNPGLAQPDLVQGCVPVNLFTPSLLQDVNGQLTDEERAYLFSTRSFDTIYEQTLFNAFISGDILETPAGAIGVAAGIEYRIDSIDSEPDADAAEGLLFGFFSDLGAEGEKWTREAFFETIIPVAANQPLFRELNVEASARWTEDEFYGSAWTYSTKAGWRPFDPLLLKASYGTSFRAPNLRENFINGISGFTQVFDPCAVPEAAISIQPGGGVVYDPNLDPRRQDEDGLALLANCTREGRDPTTVGFDPAQGNTFNVTGIEIETGGTENIGPETSTSFTAGFAFEQPWFDSFDLNLNVNYYDIEIEDSIIEPSAAFLVGDCFGRGPGQPRSLSCDRLSYNNTPNGRGLIDFVEAGFLNQDKDTVAGFDYNLTFSTEFEAFDTPLDFGANIRVNKLEERAQLFINPDTFEEQREDFVGEFGFPEYTGNAQFTLDIADAHRVTWTTRYVGEVRQEAGGVDLFGSALGTPYLTIREDRGTVEGFPVFTGLLSFDDAVALDNLAAGASYELTSSDFSDTITRDANTGELLNSAGAVVARENAFSNTCLGIETTIDGVDGGDTLCRDVGFAEEYFEHTVSYRYQADTWRLIVGIDNVFDEEPPLVDSSEVFSRSNVPIGNGYDLDGRQYFISFRKDFQ